MERQIYTTIKIKTSKCGKYCDKTCDGFKIEPFCYDDVSFYCKFSDGVNRFNFLKVGKKYKRTDWCKSHEAK